MSERKRRRGRPRWPTAAKAVRSDHAKAMDATKHTDNALPVRSFRTLLKDLANLTFRLDVLQPLGLQDDATGSVRAV